VFAHNPDLLVNPASVTKIFTTAAALWLLHPEYRFETELISNARPERGVVKGPLYVRGTGDPFMVSERMTYLAMELKAYGLRKVEGPLILDDSYFDDVSSGPGWSQDDTSEPYQAPMGALSLNFNSVSVLVFPAEAVSAPARIELLPSSEAFKVENQVTTVPRGTRVRVRVSPLGRQTKILAKGQIGVEHPGLRTMVRVEDPSWYFGYSLIEALRREGIQIGKTVRRGKAPERGNLLLTFRSPSLGELIRTVNKRSQNFMAEQLYKTLGAEFLGPPGSWWKGQQVITAFMEEEVGVPAGSYVLHNGSGLNDTNRVSAAQVVKLLRTMAKRHDVRADFEASLAVGGADGTVAGRFTAPDVARALRVKTGSLGNVRALAGYVTSRNGETFAFAFLVSRYGCGSYQVLELIDRLGATLAQTDANHQVVGEVELPPLPLPDPDWVTPDGPPEGLEEGEIPIGENGTSIAPP
jgi:D-alanyl-D-alanine carboxypeptidase/D-alanyl-D-alanine-endopeptidase (penicillin-binding protein 4)